jgi:hypothetical protein
VVPGASEKVERGRGLWVARGVRRGLDETVGAADGVRVAVTVGVGVGVDVEVEVGLDVGVGDVGIAHGLAKGVHSAARTGVTTPGTRLRATAPSTVATADSSRTRTREATAGTATMVGAPRAAAGPTCRA